MACSQSWWTWSVWRCLAPVALVVVAGCAEPPAPKATARSDRANPERPAAKPAPDQEHAVSDEPRPRTALRPKPETIVDTMPEVEPPVEFTIPLVKLTDTEAATSRIQVGDALPSFQLPDPDGKVHSFDELKGERLTVVVFWTADRPFAVEELVDLGPHVASRYSGRGVKVIAINPQDTAETVRAKAQATKSDFPLLVDRGGDYFAKLATGRLPRTYLVDTQGNVIWFDIDYGRTTRRELQQAIQTVLRKEA